jgi:hypothetical protein
LPSAFVSSGYFIAIGMPTDLAHAQSNWRFVQKFTEVGNVGAAVLLMQDITLTGTMLS